MQIRLLAVSTALVVTGSAFAWAGSAGTAVPAQPLVAADGHQLAARDAALAVPDRVGLRTASAARAEAVAYWGTEQTDASPAAENSLVGRLGVGMATFWTGGYVGEREETQQLPTDVACQVAHCFSWKLQLTRPATRLRVALDTPSRESSFTIEAIDPSGTTV